VPLLIPDSTTYLPVLLSVHDVMMYIRDSLPTAGVDLNPIITAMLDKVVRNRVNTYGLFMGPLGAYKVQAPENLRMDDLTIDMHLHEAEVYLIDMLAAALPHAPMDMKDFYYVYPRGEDQTNLIVYVPMDKSQCPPALHGKLVPAAAVRHTAR